MPRNERTEKLRLSPPSPSTACLRLGRLLRLPRWPACGRACASPGTPGAPSSSSPVHLCPCHIAVLVDKVEVALLPGDALASHACLSSARIRSHRRAPYISVLTQEVEVTVFPLYSFASYSFCHLIHLFLMKWITLNNYRRSYDVKLWASDVSQMSNAAQTQING